MCVQSTLGCQASDAVGGEGGEGRCGRLFGLRFLIYIYSLEMRTSEMCYHETANIHIILIQDQKIRNKTYFKA